MRSKNKIDDKYEEKKINCGQQFLIKLLYMISAIENST